jgi:hypothetical protein
MGRPKKHAEIQTPSHQSLTTQHEMPEFASHPAGFQTDEQGNAALPTCGDLKAEGGAAQSAPSPTVDRLVKAAIPAFSRDESTGLVKGVQYAYCEDTGLINWRKMVDKEFLVANAARLPDGVNPKDVNIDNLNDNELLILLGGIKNLAQLRGYTSVKYIVHSVSQSYAAITCGIEWLPNFETGMEPVYFEATADAHFDNTKSFARDFLLATAENRAFTRAVRNFLRINIVGSDEMGDNKGEKASSFPEESKPVSSLDPANVLANLMEKSGITLESIKKKLFEEGLVGAVDWSSISDIPKDQIFKLIERIKKKQAEKK